MTGVPENWPSLAGISWKYLRTTNVWTLNLGLKNIGNLPFNAFADWPSQAIKIPHVRQANIRPAGMNKIAVLFNVDIMSFEFKLEFFFRSCRSPFWIEDAVLPQNRHKFAVLILWVPASAISIPRNTSITDVDMAAVTNSTSQIKTTPCTFFTDRAQH